jgi:hypothetical protein
MSALGGVGLLCQGTLEAVSWVDGRSFYWMAFYTHSLGGHGLGLSPLLRDYSLKFLKFVFVRLFERPVGCLSRSSVTSPCSWG